MKRWLVVGLLVLAGLGPANDLSACGDKFLIISRGTRFQRAAFRRPANILIYSDSNSTLTQSLGNVPVAATLSKAGYRTTSVSGALELENALRSGGWDLVVTDLADGAALRGRVQGPNAPLVLPVAFKPTKQDLNQAKKDFKVVVKGPIKSQYFLDVVDATVEYVVKQRTKP
jgi:DNA-binding NtrC family response regulator